MHLVLTKRGLGHPPSISASLEPRTGVQSSALSIFNSNIVNLSVMP
jgi:hypothetical protein